MNIATNCDNCGRTLGPDKYVVSPTEGGVCQKRGWCPGCYETLHKLATKARVERRPNYYATSKVDEDNYGYGED